MKVLFAVLGILTFSALSASAQKKLWTWSVKDKSKVRAITSIAMNEDGSGAFVLGEGVLKGPLKSYLLVWVDPKGKVLLSRRTVIEDVPLPWSPGMGQEPAIPQWELSFTGFDRLIARYDKKIFLFEARAGKAVLVKTLPAERKITFGTALFGGWVEYTGPTIYVIKGHPQTGSPGDPGYSPAVPDQVVKSSDTVTAWKF